MPRHARSAPGGYVYHALNRAVARLPLFQKHGDYEAFGRKKGTRTVSRKKGTLWSSLSDRRVGLPKIDLHPWPVPRPLRWRSYVNRVETEGELEAVRRSVARGQPFGDDGWQQQTVKELGLEYTLRSPGRPRKPKPNP